MTKQEAISHLKKLEYKYISFGLLLTDLMTYKQENFEVLRDCKNEIKELRIYENECKFRLVFDLKNENHD